MRTLFNSKQNESVLPVPAALLTTLFFYPVVGKAQDVYTSAGAGQAPDMGGSDMASIVGQLEYNALLALLGAVVLMGIIWICHVSKACADLNRPQEDTHRPFMTLLILVAALSVCGSCTAEQRAMATQYRAMEAAENRTCPLQHHYENAPFNDRYPYDGYCMNACSVFTLRRGTNAAGICKIPHYLTFSILFFYKNKPSIVMD